MELVIKIPEEIRLALIHNIQLSPDQKSTSEAIISQAIINGTPLPKGHGDLIDRGKLKTHFVGTEQGTDLEVYLESTIIGAQTIIESESE